MAKRQRPRAGHSEGRAPRAERGRSARKGTAPGRAANGVSSHLSPPPSAIVFSPDPNPDAVSVFEKAMAALQRHSYSEAAEGFRQLLTGFPGERTLLDRARVYLDLCERELRRRPSGPRTIEERLTAATAALNDADEDRAERLATSVLAESPEDDLALYLLAAVHARRGARESAFDLLRQAAALSPDVRAQARHDPDFDDLHEMDAFRDLVENVTPTSHRRPRRARPER
jgi:tetratricopeptide (TPR) repeat protein